MVVSAHPAKRSRDSGAALRSILRHRATRNLLCSSGEGISGELTAHTLERIAAFVDEDSVFFDVGSGRGNVLWGMATLLRDKLRRAEGWEIDDNMARHLEPMLQRFVQTREFPHANVRAHHGDFVAVKKLPSMPPGCKAFVYSFNVGQPKALRAHTLALVEGLGSKLHRFVSFFDHTKESKRLVRTATLHGLKQSGSGASYTAYVYEPCAPS